MTPPNPYDGLQVTSGNATGDLTATLHASVSPEPTYSEDDELLAIAQDRFARCVAWESPWRTSASEELKFVDALEHWDAGMKEERKGRPCLTFDRIGPAVDQVINDARQNPPEAKVAPVGAGADDETAELIQGLIRNVDQDSAGPVAYLTGYEHAVKIGRGWFRIHIDYEDDPDHPFWQKVVILRVPNPFGVYPDPAAEAFDYSDMRYCFVTEDLSEEMFKQLYPDALPNGAAMESIDDRIRNQWWPKGGVRVAEYWWVESQFKVIVQLDGGEVMDFDQVPEDQKNRIRNKRRQEKRTVFMAKITGSQVLEKTQWPGKWIPIVPVLGKEIIKEGKRSLRGMVRPAMDGNLMFDYMISKEAETFGLASIVQWLVAEGSIENFEYQWAQANRKALPFMEFKTEVGGKPVPPPQRIFSNLDVTGMAQLVSQLDETTKYSLSTWNPSLGAPSPESSGRAITARQREADNAHFNFHDNLMRSLRHAAKIELDLFPHVYSEERMISIMDPDGSNRQVKINAPFVEKGAQKLFRLAGPARYDITLAAGPSYASRRAEGADKLVQIAQFIPQIGQMAPDLVVKALDIPDGDQIADRIRPAGIRQEQDGEQPIPPQVQAALQQAQGIMQAQGAELAALKQLLDSKILDLESRERIATQGNITKLAVAEASAKNAAVADQFERDHDHVQNSLDRRAGLLDTAISVHADAEQAEAQRQHELQMQAQQAQQQQQPPSGPPAAP